MNAEISDAAIRRTKPQAPPPVVFLLIVGKNKPPPVERRWMLWIVPLLKLAYSLTRLLAYCLIGITMYR